MSFLKPFRVVAFFVIIVCLVFAKPQKGQDEDKDTDTTNEESDTEG